MAVLPRAAQWPHYQAPMAVLSRPAQFGHFVKSNPIAILSRPAPMAILLSKSNGKFIKDSPRATSSRQPQWLFYQGKLPSHQSQLPLYQIKAGFLKPATAIYQGQPQWQLYDGCGGKGQPLGLALGGPSRYCAGLIEAGPDGQFINAASNRKGQPLDLEFINGRPATDLIEASPDGKFIKASSNRKSQPLHLALGGPTRYCAA